MVSINILNEINSNIGNGFSKLWRQINEAKTVMVGFCSQHE